ncbi:ubiquitin conjugation factor E4 A-like isoform X1 [Argonauta hians]
MSSENTSSNPFAALLGASAPSVPQRPNDSTAGNNDDNDTVSERFNLSCILGEIFLVTLDPEDVNTRPKVVMKTVSSQTWLDLKCLQQGLIIERLWIDDPKQSVVCNRETSKRPDSLLEQDMADATENKALHYLFSCYVRARDLLDKETQFAAEIRECIQMLLENASLCLLSPDLVENQYLSNQFIDVFFSNYKTSLGSKCEAMLEFFTSVTAIIHKDGDGSVEDAFQPVLDAVHNQMKEYNSQDISLKYLTDHLDLLTFFYRSEPLALAFIKHSTPQGTSPNAYECTLLGCLLHFSCIDMTSVFENNATKSEDELTEIQIWKLFGSMRAKILELFQGLIKVSPDSRHRVLTWIADCLHSNEGRGKIWSNQQPQLYCSDGFFINLSYVMLHLCLPFCKVAVPKTTKIDPTYPGAVAASEEEAKVRYIHAKGLKKFTCLISSKSDSICSSSSNNNSSSNNGEEEEATEMDEDKAGRQNSSSGSGGGNGVGSIGGGSGVAGQTVAGSSSLGAATTATSTVAVDDDDDGRSYNFITECFYLTHLCLVLGYKVSCDKYMHMVQDLNMINQSRMRNTNPDNRTYLHDEFKKEWLKFMGLKAALREPDLLDMCLHFHSTTAIWLSQLAVFGTASEVKEIQFPLPSKPPSLLAQVPEFTIDNINTFMSFVSVNKPDSFSMDVEQLKPLMTVMLVFMGSPERMSNPHLRASLAQSLAALIPTEKENKIFYENEIFRTHPLASRIMEMLLHVFVSIELNGEAVAFELKFNYRRPIYNILEYVWQFPLHRNVIKDLAKFAEDNIESSEAPLFLQFINLLINDAIFLLDEALSYMMQIRQKEQEVEATLMHDMSAEQLEMMSSLRQITMLAQHHNIMANLTISAIELLTTEIKDIFTHNSMVDRVSNMLNYFLEHLVGPKRKNLIVKDKNEYDFKPKEIVSNICKIYLNLAGSDKFCLGVISDSRSFNKGLMAKAKDVLYKIGWPQADIEHFEEFDEKIKALEPKARKEDEVSSEAPEEFMDPIMFMIMKDPVILPSSQKTVDRTTIQRHLLSDMSDPFNREPLTMDKVIPNVELKEKIDRWMRGKTDEK